MLTQQPVTTSQPALYSDNATYMPLFLSPPSPLVSFSISPGVTPIVVAIYPPCDSTSFTCKNGELKYFWVEYSLTGLASSYSFDLFLDLASRVGRIHLDFLFIAERENGITIYGWSGNNRKVPFTTKDRSRVSTIRCMKYDKFGVVSGYLGLGNSTLKMIHLYGP
ncbi:hypothetical protein VNO80_06308 [Phaseolus coccineus]|uniref:Uncharacterized protein n=1 Tax=Phaseolus coccineus TaxID=3886 RepID=A0AAN9RNR8_PHACN